MQSNIACLDISIAKLNIVIRCTVVILTDTCHEQKVCKKKSLNTIWSIFRMVIVKMTVDCNGMTCFIFITFEQTNKQKTTKKTGKLNAQFNDFYFYFLLCNLRYLFNIFKDPEIIGNISN